MRELDWLERRPRQKLACSSGWSCSRRVSRCSIFRFRISVERARAPAADRRVHRGGRRPSGLDGPARRAPRAPARAAGLVPRLRAVGVRAALAQALIHTGSAAPPGLEGGVGVSSTCGPLRAVLDNGGVFAQMPEGTVRPVGRIRPFRIEAALIAPAHRGADRPPGDRRYGGALPGAPDGRPRLPPTTVRELLEESWGGRCRRGFARAELDLARTLTDRFAERLGPVVEELHPGAVDRRTIRGGSGKWFDLAAPGQGSARPGPPETPSSLASPRLRRARRGNRPVRAYSAAMDYAETILDLVGNTPLVRLTRVSRDRAAGTPAAHPGKLGR